MTLIGPGTWEAARAAADVALTAADLVADGAPWRIRAAAARPDITSRGSPTAARATSTTPRSLRSGCASAAPTASASLDVDAHHGNGAQEIFWDRSDVFTGSVHVDPATGWFPHFLGTAAERGAGAGRGRTCNVPLPPGAGDADWLRAVAEIGQAARSHGIEALVVALGVDAAAADPESPLQVTEAGYREAGRVARHQALPTVVVQEGGYDLAVDRRARARGVDRNRGGAGGIGCLNRCSVWIGIEDSGGIPRPERVDVTPPPHWRLEAIAATERPRSLTIAPTGERLSSSRIATRPTSGLIDLERRGAERLTTGRDPQPYWEDTQPVVSPDGASVAYGDRRLDLARPARRRAGPQGRRGGEPGVAR